LNGPRRRRGAALARGAAAVLAAAIALTLALLGSGRAPRVAAEVGGGPPRTYAYTDLAVPAEDVVMLGASTSEPGAPAGATWGIGQLREVGEEAVPKLVRSVPPENGTEGEWEPGPELPAGFQPDHPGGKPSPLEGQVTGEGYGVLAGTIAREAQALQTVLVRKPGGAFEVTTPVTVESEAAKTEKEETEAKPAGEEPGAEAGEGSGAETHEEPLLRKGQTLFGPNRAPMIAPLAESDGSAGAVVVPVYSGEGVDEFVLHWDGRHWTREPIEIPVPSEKEFKVLAVAAAGRGNAWLLARLSSAYGSGAVALFRRVKTEAGGGEEGGDGEGGREDVEQGEAAAGEGDGWRWKPVEVETGPGQVELALSVPVSGGVPARGEPFSAFGAEGSQITVQSQLLTVTGEGVWVDGVRSDVERQQPYTTMYVRPEVGPHGEQRGVIEQSWCKAAAETPPCLQTLAREPPLLYGRSFAWPSAAPYGERVIAGLAEGVVLRLQGASFEPVLSIGGEETAEGVPGRLYGAAFSSPGEGWLGYSVPVRLTPSPATERLANWPVATRHPLLAIAPQPGAPVAALGSEALAVGESGGVARYKPGEGWLPETLFGPGERIEKPFLRAVAWPRANRAYAVGQEGEMWLWRGETGLWERDPATPINFRANLYGVAFDPANPARGYAVGTRAVGSGGVLLRYNKTWTEETALPAEVQNAQFNGIAFAGSQALVAFNVQRNPGETGFDGGLLVNEGGGWSVDQEERQITGAARVRAVAGLPDGGAAVLAGEGTVRLYERESQSAPWRLEAVPLRSGVAGSLALYRLSDGALRALVATGGASGVTHAIPFEPSPGSPPYEQPIAGVGAGTGPTAGALLRQTATGWSDEAHDVNPVTRGRNYNEYDEPVHPDPLAATLVSPSGGEAWVVGGIASERENEQTADIVRYPASTRPPNQGLSQVPIEPEEAGSGGTGGVTTLAFGGGAGCADPCADRVMTGVGPDVWLAKAVSLAQGAGASAFFYTGPMVHYAPYNGQIAPRPPFSEEYERYAAIFEAGPAPVYAASAEGELEGELALPGAFEGLASPLGSSPASGWQTASPPPGRAEREGCGCAQNYYAVESAHVVAIVLDDAAGAGVDAAQRIWLEQRLAQAGTAHKAAIVIGEADLGAQLAPGKHDEAAEALFAALAGRDPDGQDPGGYAASAYFYDAREQNVGKTISFAGATLPAFGSGTLGYELESHEETTEFHGAKGILLGEVQWGAASAAERTVDRAPVAARLIPVIEELAIEPQSGTLLRRSEAAVFRGLARRPRAGCRGLGALNLCEEGQYIPIPSICVGVTCSQAVLPEYEFRSSRPDVGGFVKLNTASTNGLSSGAFVPSNAVLLNAQGEAVKDGREEGGEQVGATSGLFCAYNKGETNVTISAGGLSYTLPVRVQAGSVRQPCGTVPAKQEVAADAAAVPPAAPAQAPAGAAPASPLPILPVPPPPPALAAPPALPAPFLSPSAPSSPLPGFVPPPIPTPARPTPPTGTSAVTSPVEIAEHEEEEEHATESVSNQALAYRVPEHEPSPAYILGIVLIAAFAGASTRARMRRGRRELRVAPATLNTMRAQRRLTREPPRR
jgi:hypothetical protein